MPNDKFIRVSQETHQKLTDAGKKGETYDYIINRLLEVDLKKEKILILCDEIEKIVTERYPTMKHPLMSPAAGMMKRDIHEKILEIKKLLESVF